MDDLKKGHELEEPPYDYHKINQFEQIAYTTFTHVNKIRFDDKKDEIVLFASIEITPTREEIIASQLQDIARQMSRPLQVVDVTENELRVSMPQGFKFK